MMKILAVAAIIGTVLAGVIGSAAALGVTGGSVQAGSDAELTCDANGVQVLHWNTDYNGVVTSIEVGDIDPACLDNHLLVTVKGDTGQLIGVGASINPATGGAPLLFAPAPSVTGTETTVQLAGVTGGNPDGNIYGVSAHEIYSIDIVIEGGS